MEKILNDDEKIRRAEEIYFRRNNRNLSFSNKPAIREKGGFKNKFFLHLLLMFNIAVIIFAVQNKDYIFTSEFLGELERYNVNISAKITEFLKETVADEKKQEINDEIPSQNSNEEKMQNESNEEANKIAENSNLEGENNGEQELSSSLTEMELDVQNLKASYSFIKPLEGGIVSSGFGSRESEYQKVTGYHTGVDVAAEKGTKIKASMEGIVTLVSSEGDYGKHIKIRCNNVTTLYAHCSSIFVKEGQIVAQGQEIGAVGSTGNSTGPHLHFEIRVDDRFVDPLQILSF